MMPFSAQPNGASRNITEVFMFLRNNAQQDRITMRTFSSTDDKTSLVAFDREKDSIDIFQSTSTPAWVNILDEINYEFTRIKSRHSNLKNMQNSHLGEHLNFSDEQPAEHEKIRNLTDEITTMFNHCRKLIRVLEEAESESSKSLNILRQNVLNSLLLTFNHHLCEFRASQSSYLRHLDSRIANINNFLVASTSECYHDSNIGTLNENQGEEMTLDQIQQIIENEQMTKEREREIIKISKSILELNSLFKDIGSIIQDQGTILDRIDYNVEQTAIRVKSAYKNVEKAERYQRNKKMHLIVILTGIAIFLIFLIIITKL